MAKHPLGRTEKIDKIKRSMYFVKRIFKCIEVVGIIILKKMQNAHCSFAHFSIMRSCIEIMLHTWCRLNISSTNFKLQLKIGSLGQTYLLCLHTCILFIKSPKSTGYSFSMHILFLFRHYTNMDEKIKALKIDE